MDVYSIPIVSDVSYTYCTMITNDNRHTHDDTVI